MYQSVSNFDNLYSQTYAMKMSSESYFLVALPSIILFICGLYSLNPRLFKYDNYKLPIQSKSWILLTVVLLTVIDQIFHESNYIIFLLCSFRYVLIFYLFFYLKKDFIIYFTTFSVFLLEYLHCFKTTMFHNILMWTVFFVFLLVGIHKMSKIKLFVLFTVLILLVIVVQQIKLDTRRSWVEEDSTPVLEQSEFLSNLTVRFNQGWILSSAVERTESKNDYQGALFIESYFNNIFDLRILNSEKLDISKASYFRLFSGHDLSEGTSMALGIVAEGFISYGLMGAYLFSFFWGITIGLVYEHARRFNDLRFYSFLLCFFYVIRPDTQVNLAINHIVKSFIVIHLLFFLLRDVKTLNIHGKAN